MAGKVTKSVMYTPWRFVQLCPDLRMLQCGTGRLRADNRDDSILLGGDRRVRAGRDDVRLGPRLLPGAAREGRRTDPAPPTAAERKDIEFGWTLAKEMGRLDVGQSVAVKEQAALAVEAIEGTDRCIERAGQLCRAGGWTLVKVAKPQQDMRFDVPTDRPLDDREPAQGRRPCPGDRGGQDDRHRPARRHRPGRPLRPLNRGPARPGLTKTSRDRP